MCSCGCGANSLCAPFLAPNAKSALVPGLDTAMVLMRQGRNHDTENSSGRGGVAAAVVTDRMLGFFDIRGILAIIAPIAVGLCAYMLWRMKQKQK